MKNIRITKLKELPDARHPNNIEEGFEYTGLFMGYPIIGERFRIGFSFSTSPVKEIIDVNIFKTLNSIYKFEKID